MNIDGALVGAWCLVVGRSALGCRARRCWVLGAWWSNRRDDWDKKTRKVQRTIFVVRFRIYYNNDRDYSQLLEGSPMVCSDCSAVDVDTYLLVVPF